MKSVLKWCIFMLLLFVTILITASSNLESASQIIYKDADENGANEKYVLKSQQIQVYEKNYLLWQSPKNWKVKQMLLADADNNKQTELLLILWKKGSFGQSKPFWFKGSDNQYSCHLFLYRLRSGRMKEVWCSSALEYPILKLSVKDTNKDGLSELNVLQGPHNGFSYPIRKYFNQQKTKWVWNGWGFERIN